MLEHTQKYSLHADLHSNQQQRTIFMDSKSDRSVLVSTVSDGRDNRFSNNNIKYKKSKKEISNSLKSTNITVLRVFHQSTTGLRKKTDELISPMHTNSAHTLRLTKHHMKQLDLEHIYIENYKLGT